MNERIKIPVFIFAAALLLAPYICTATEAVTENEADVRKEVRISTTYELNPFLRGHDIQVKVINGKATLTGIVDEAVNKDLAKQIAFGVQGIKDVDNKIEINANYTTPKNNKERSFVDVIEDATISTAIKSKLLWSKYAEGLNTDVDTSFGKVTLHGSADSSIAKEMAGRLAMNTQGVTTVDNRLTINSKNPSMVEKAKGSMNKVGQQFSDGWITTKVKSTFLYSSNVNGGNISVSTKNGKVTLDGESNSDAERALAIELAENVRGVQEVKANNLKQQTGETK